MQNIIFIFNYQMPEEIIKLCDLNLSGLNPEKIIKLFWTLIKNTKDKQEYVTFIC